MSRILSFALLGFTGFSMAAPEVSQAQTPVGVQVQVGPVGFTYQNGYSYAVPGYVSSSYVVPAQTVVVAPPVIVAASPRVVVVPPVYYPSGYRYDRWYHYHHHHGHHR